MGGEQHGDSAFKATDLFPDLDEDINRRINHAEVRIKYWVILGVLVNVIALVGLGAPLVYYLGTMQAQAGVAIANLSKTSDAQLAMASEVQDNKYRTASVEQWAESQGYRPPPQMGK